MVGEAADPAGGGVPGAAIGSMIGRIAGDGISNAIAGGDGSPPPPAGSKPLVKHHGLVIIRELKVELGRVPLTMSGFLQMVMFGSTIQTDRGQIMVQRATTRAQESQVEEKEKIVVKAKMVVLNRKLR